MKFTKLTDHLKLAADKLVGFKPEPYELNPGFPHALRNWKNECLNWRSALMRKLPP